MFLLKTIMSLTWDLIVRFKWIIAILSLYSGYLLLLGKAVATINGIQG